MKTQEWLDYAAASKFRFYSGANVTIYPDSHELFISGKSVHCSRTHFRILSLLLENFCKTVLYEKLLGTERPLNGREQNVLKVQMFYLRRLLDGHGSQLEIRNVYGTGYQARPHP